MGSRQLRPIETKISWCVKVNFWKCRDLSWQSRPAFIPSQLRFFEWRIFDQDFAASRFLLRLSRQFEIFEICRDFLRFIKRSQHYPDFLRGFKLKNLDKLRNLGQEKSKIKKSQSRWRQFCSLLRLTFWHCQDKSRPHKLI